MKQGDQIRSALRHHYLRRFNSQPGALVIDELGLIHARSRIDVAVINGHIHGYEIKSAHDTLRRLPHQLEIYRQTLQRLTLVVDVRHVSAIREAVPAWCGILTIRFGPRGGARFSQLRKSQPNPDLDPLKLAHLLWRSEAQAALAMKGATRRDLRAPRQDLYQQLVAQVSTSELVTLIRKSMITRKAWRDRPRPS